jgi:hypothetical protein
MTAPAHENPAGVSSIELFFDLVFVFVITQVTQLVEHAHGAMDFLRALLVLVPIWWMYAAYVWLTAWRLFLYPDDCAGGRNGTLSGTALSAGAYHPCGA